MDLNELIERSKKGDLEAYRLIIREMAPQVKAFLLSRLKDFHTAEDISQEVFLSAYKALNKFEGNKHFKTWLISIAKYKLIDHVRYTSSQDKLKAAYEQELHDLLHEDADLNEDMNQQLSKLKSCIKQLPEEAATLIKSRYFNCESVMGLAYKLGSSENAISSKLFRLKKKLKNCIELS